jgi:hypothetical protein
MQMSFILIHPTDIVLDRMKNNEQLNISMFPENPYKRLIYFIDITQGTAEQKKE